MAPRPLSSRKINKEKRTCDHEKYVNIEKLNAAHLPEFNSRDHAKSIVEGMWPVTRCISPKQEWVAIV